MKTSSPPILLGIMVCLSLMAGSVSGQTYKETIGFNKLQAELGAETPDGSGIGVSQIELNDGSGNYRPSLTAGEFSGKTFTLKSGASSTLNHATSVGTRIYGNDTSIAPGVTEIDVYAVRATLADGFIGSDFLRYGSSSAPVVETNALQNHSWIAQTGNASVDTEILRRLDFAVGRDDFLAVVGVGNDGNNANLLSSAYNVISVGVSAGTHGSGSTTVDGSGRLRPHIVAPNSGGGFGGNTSAATAVVSSAAALLYDAAGSSSLGLDADAERSQVMKVVLLTGADKKPFPGWSRTETQPLDSTYGAGQLNIYNSYHILAADKQSASTTEDVASTGWDFNSASDSSPKYYFFESDDAFEFKATLTWHREISANPAWTNISSTVGELHLKLYEADGYVLGNLVDQSISSIDNIQHIWQPLLTSGRYAIEVVSLDSFETDFAVAWSIPEPSLIVFMATGLSMIFLRRRRGA